MPTTMSHTETPVSSAGHSDDASVDQGGDSAPSEATGLRQATGRTHPVAPFVGGTILCVVALVLLAAGGWALWKDRVDRDGKGFVSFGTTELKTEQHAIVGDLRGDGPSWLYGSAILGDARVRATSPAEQPLFIGIARKGDVLRYLREAGYATIYSFEVSADTTHPGGAPSGPPSRESFWAASTQGTGEQTLLWTPRSGDWSIVFMNADASANVDVRGDAGAKLPILPWLAGALLIAAAASGVAGGRVLVRAIRREYHPPRSEPDDSQPATTSTEAGSASDAGVPRAARS